MKTPKQRVDEWLFFAQSDLDSAEISLREEIYHHACFHAHQCLEKVFKAFLVGPETTPPKSHDLEDLLEKIGNRRRELLEFREEIKWMNEFYVPTRYPDAFVGSLPEGLPTKEDAQKAVKIAKKIFEKEKKILESKT